MIVGLILRGQFQKGNVNITMVRREETRNTAFHLVPNPVNRMKGMSPISNPMVIQYGQDVSLLENLIFSKKVVLACLAHTDHEHSASSLKSLKDSVRRACRGPRVMMALLFLPRITGSLQVASMLIFT